MSVKIALTQLSGELSLSVYGASFFFSTYRGPTTSWIDYFSRMCWECYPPPVLPACSFIHSFHTYFLLLLLLLVSSSSSFSFSSSSPFLCLLFPLPLSPLPPSSSSSFPFLFLFLLLLLLLTSYFSPPLHSPPTLPPPLFLLYGFIINTAPFHRHCGWNRIPLPVWWNPSKPSPACLVSIQCTHSRLWLLFQVTAIQWWVQEVQWGLGLCVSYHCPRKPITEPQYYSKTAPLTKAINLDFQFHQAVCVTLVWLIRIWYATEHTGTVFHRYLFIIARHCTPEHVVRNVSRKWASCHSQQTDCVMEFCYDIFHGSNRD